MKYTWNITPMGAPRTTRADSWKKRPVILKYHAFRDAIAKEMKRSEKAEGQKFWHLLDCLDVVFHMPMPASWSKKKKEKMFGTYHQQKPDIDNLVKAVLDSIFRNGDDCRVFTVRATKIWSTDGKIIIQT